MAQATGRTIDDEQRIELDLAFERARKALAIIETYDQARVDRLCQAVAWAVANKRTFTRLGRHGHRGERPGRRREPHGQAHEDPRRAARRAAQKSVGAIESLPEKGIVKYGKPRESSRASCRPPIPTSRPPGNAIYGIKARDVVIFAPHPRSKNTSFETCA
jgi:sulfoacetaldehyde dehydrogenase